MHKKASLNLSINAIVILILAITMLGLGLTFMRTIFSSATQEFEEISGTIHKQMIDQMKEKNKEIDLSSLVYDIKPGEKKQVYIGFKNTGNEEKNFSINGINVNSLSGDATNCGLYEDGNNVIIEYKQTPTKVQAGETIVLPINIKTSSNANKDSCFYELLIDSGKEGDRTPVPLKKGLVGYWNFDDGTAKDSSGNNNDGTLGGGVDCNADGRYGKSCEFDGGDSTGDYINCGGADFFNITGELTVSAWVYPKKEATTQGRMAVNMYDYRGSPSSQDTGWYFGQVWTGDYFRMQIHDGIGGSDSASYSGFFNDYLNQWVYLVGIYKPSQYVYLYINGELVASDTTGVKSSIVYSNDPLIIGRRSAEAQSYWNGTIDEVRIYNRSLSQSEIQQLYTGYDSSIQLTVNVE